MTNNHSYEKLTSDISSFVAERDWRQFHSPKNLVMALAVEVAELTEIFQWQTEQESYAPDEAVKHHIEEEIGDIMIYLATIAEKFNINPIAAGLKKIEKNKHKYPVDLVRGKSLKYNNY